MECSIVRMRADAKAYMDSHHITKIEASSEEAKPKVHKWLEKLMGKEKPSEDLLKKRIKLEGGPALSREEADLVKLLVALRDANTMIVEAINTYLEAKAPSEVKFEIAELFPNDLADILTFEETPEWTIIRPKQYLGSEKFNEVLAVVKDHKGEYVSQGKLSHFRIKRQAEK